MSDSNEKIRGIVIDTSDLAPNVSILVPLYKELGLTQYVQFANFDGFYELMSPDLFVNLQSLTIEIRNWSTWQTHNSRDASLLGDLFDDLSRDWQQMGKEFIFRKA